MKDPSDTHLRLAVDAPGIPLFFQLLAQGFKVRERDGCGVREFLSGRLGIREAYLEEKVQTLLLNGKVVDDPQTAKVGEGAVLALSAAMPGAAGVVFRKESRYAQMRSQVTHKRDSSSSAPAEPVTVVVKYFNLIAADLGPALLGQGIWVSGENLQGFLQARWDDLRAFVKKVRVDREEVDPGNLPGMDWKGGSVFLQVKKDG